VLCCAKLLLLPAVIVWQLFEELRDKLAAKYQELQQKKQVRGEVIWQVAKAGTADKQQQQCVLVMSWLAAQ
jgi:hypothetical protein